MTPLAPHLVAPLVGGELLAPGDGAAVTHVFIDTRRPPTRAGTGGLAFVALEGPNHDAHDHLLAAVDAGATLLVVSNVEAVPDGLDPSVALVRADDGYAALAALGRAARAAHPGKIVAITGSVGKTTVKDMVAAALGAFGKVGATPGNWNNAIGLPLTLCNLDGDEDFVVLELGMSASGEIAALAAMAQPDVGVVTCARAAHLEFFDSVEGIADAKGEMFAALTGDAVAVCNADDPRMVARLKAFVPDGKRFGYGTPDGVSMQLLEATVHEPNRPGGPALRVQLRGRAGEGSLDLHSLARHDGHNAAGALCVVHALGLDVGEAARSLAAGWRPGAHRLQRREGEHGLVVIDDSYNSSPTSANAALYALADASPDGAGLGAVMGSMYELGETADQLHHELGQLAATLGLERLWALGDHAEAMVSGAREAGLARADVVTDLDEAAAEVTAWAATTAADASWLLLKGSRANHLDRLLAPLGVGDRGGAS